MAAIPLTVVLDTNVVLDWLLFDNPFMDNLKRSVGHQCIRIVTHAIVCDELQRVLGYRQLDLTDARRKEIFERYLSQTFQPGLPADFSRESLFLPRGFPQCKDRDDQVFLALAYHTKAGLVSRDKAILNIANRAKKFSVRIFDVQEFMAGLG